MICYEVDWPLWHQEHWKARRAYLAGETFFDPWEYSETRGIASFEPVDFQEVVRSLKAMCGPSASSYFVSAWNSAQVIDYPKPNPIHHAAMVKDFNSLKSEGGVIAMKEASFQELLEHSKRDDLIFSFRKAAVKRPAKNSDSIEMIRTAGPNSELGRALICAPRWETSLFMRAPPGMTWGQFQDFRYLFKAMAGDLAAHATGFDVFKNRNT